MNDSLKFNILTIEDKDRVQSYLAKSPYMGCETVFTNLYAWNDTFPYELAFDSDFLYIRYKIGGKIRYSMPLGNGDMKAAVEKLIIDSGELGIKLKIGFAGSQQVSLLSQHFPDKFKINQYRDSFDYVYLSSSLAELRGKKLHSKRNHVNKFISMYPDYSVDEITEKNIDKCYEVYDGWKLSSSPDEGEYKAIKRVLSNYRELGCFGIILKVENKPVAFCYGTARSNDMFVTHVEKALYEYQGAFNMINMEFAKRLTKYKYINREDDVGEEGLRKVKLSYKPHMLIEKYMAEYIYD